MAKASNNEFPSILFTEQASAPATPGSGLVRAYFKADGIYYVDDTGTEHGPFTTGTPVAPTSQADTTYTLTSTDSDDVIRFTNASQATVTIPTDASEDLADGFEVVLFAEGAGGLTLSTTGITLLGSSPNTTISQNEALWLKKTAAANTWMVVGGTAA